MIYVKCILIIIRIWCFGWFYVDVFCFVVLCISKFSNCMFSVLEPLNSNACVRMNMKPEKDNFSLEKIHVDVLLEEFTITLCRTQVSLCSFMWHNFDGLTWEFDWFEGKVLHIISRIADLHLSMPVFNVMVIVLYCLQSFYI